MRLLLAIDVGNTQTVVGAFKEDKLLSYWRLSTRRDRTADEIALSIAGFLNLAGLDIKDVTGMAVSSVVPEMTQAIAHMARDILNIEPLVVNSNTNTGLRILYDDPSQVGADRLVNAVAAIEKYGNPCIVVDFGTATTLDAINKEGDYVGGAIMPGIEISADALFRHAARLSRVELVAPSSPIGKNTVESIQAGIVYGTAGQVDRLVELFKAELGEDAAVVGTGGLAEIVAGKCRTIKDWDPLLTLYGLKILYEKNRG